MPMTLYTQEEYDQLRRKCDEFRTSVKVLEDMRPAWTLDAHITIAALTQLWRMLGVTNQTAAVHKLNLLLEGRSTEFGA